MTTNETTQALVDRLHGATSERTRTRLRQELVRSHLPLAEYIARRYGSSKIDADERTAICSAALVTFFHDPPARITHAWKTYVAHVLRNALWQESAAQLRPASVSWPNRRKVVAGHESLFHASADDPDSVDERFEQSCFPPPDAGIEQRDAQRRVAAIINAAQPPLTNDEHQVIELRFGLRDGIERSAAEVAFAMDIDAARAKQLSDQALKKLKRSALEISELEKSALHKLKRGQGIVQRNRARKVVTPATCHPNRPALKRGRHKGLCSACVLADYRSQPASCHPQRKLFAKGLCRHCYTERNAKGKSTTCGHLPFYKKSQCRRCYDTSRYRDGGLQRRHRAKEKRSHG